MHFWNDTDLKLIEKEVEIWAIKHHYQKKIGSLLSALKNCQKNMEYLLNELESLREKEEEEKKDHPREDDLMWN